MSNIFTRNFFAKENYTATKNTIVGTLDIQNLLQITHATEKKGFSSKDIACKAVIGSGGWQSWSPCFETHPGQKQSSGGNCILRPMKVLIDFPETKFRPNKNVVLCPFICYLRLDEFYLVIVSLASVCKTSLLPPVQFVLNRSTAQVEIELADSGKVWKDGELQSEIAFFTADSYFEVKDTLKSIFDCGQFAQIEFLGKKALGWESWYNHYTQIDEKIIIEDLNALAEKETVLSLLNSDYSDTSDIANSTNTKGKTPIIFQIDDGWETSVGDWSIHQEKFPGGLKSLANQIENRGFIPGLWIAPFLLYEKSPVALEHPDWLLRNKNGKPVCAGVNPGWNGLKPLCCLDLSQDEVLSYLDSIMDKAINDWGFRYLKLDFMYAGMLHGSFKNGGAAYEWYEKAIKLLTRRKTTKDGKKIAYLGCGIPMEQSYKDFPLSRIGCDTYEHWENKFLKLIKWNARNEAYLNLKDTLGRSLWDKTIYANDPDVIFIRNKNCSLTRDEKLLIALTGSIFASQIMYSDDPSDINSVEEIELAREISKECKKYNCEFSVKEMAPDFYQLKSRDGKISGTINLKKGEIHKIVFN
ncbi:MAG: glycoside hydrolase family 36 protein [Treponemataceae bacterium]|nr:alpha-galactosidase [Spirochaetales bacterium]MDY6030586.1 glycoside hydrolase family 36 protein [Treponemataceae bacterium]